MILEMCLLSDICEFFKVEVLWLHLEYVNQRKVEGDKRKKEQEAAAEKQQRPKNWFIKNFSSYLLFQAGKRLNTEWSIKEKEWSGEVLRPMPYNQNGVIKMRACATYGNSLIIDMHTILTK